MTAETEVPVLKPKESKTLYDIFELLLLCFSCLFVTSRFTGCVESTWGKRDSNMYNIFGFDRKDYIKNVRDNQVLENESKKISNANNKVDGEKVRFNLDKETGEYKEKHPEYVNKYSEFYQWHNERGNVNDE